MENPNKIVCLVFLNNTASLSLTKPYKQLINLVKDLHAHMNRLK